jgi:anti-sigma factor RsiW
MDMEMWESRIIDYLDGKGSTEERTKLEQELSQDAEANKLFEQLQEVMLAMDKVSVLEPSSQLKMEFDKALQQEIAAQKKTTKTVFFSPIVYRVAAGFLLIMAGLVIGYEINKNQEHERELIELKQQVEENRLLMLAMLDNQQSASQRMVGVSVAYELETADDQIVQVLVKTLNEDTNSNVRLAALEALGKFSSEEVVRQSLIKSLTTQKDPVVQIALIQLLVKMKEKGVLNQLEKITKDASTMKAVKDEAHKGILKLS